MKHLFKPVVVLGTLALLFAACEKLTTKEVDVSYPLGGNTVLSQTLSKGSLTSVYYLDPGSSSAYQDYKDQINEITDPAFVADIRNNSGCNTTFRLWVSQTYVAHGIPGGALKAGEVSIPGPAGNISEITSGDALSSAGVDYIITHLEGGTPFYVYFQALGAGCSNVNISVLNPTLQATLVVDLL